MAKSAEDPPRKAGEDKGGDRKKVNARLGTEAAGQNESEQGAAIEMRAAGGQGWSKGEADVA